MEPNRCLVCVCAEQYRFMPVLSHYFSDFQVTIIYQDMHQHTQERLLVNMDVNIAGSLMLTKSQFCKWFMRKEKCYSCLSPFKDSQHCILTFCPITPDWNYCLGITCCKFITSRIKAHQVFVCFTCNVQIKEKWLSLAIN